MLFYIYRIKIRRNKITCKQCIYFKKNTDLDKCEENQVNGSCCLNPPTILIFANKITYTRPGVNETDVTCEKFVELERFSGEKASVDPKDN